MKRARKRTEWEQGLVLFLIVAAGATVAGLIVAKIVGDQVTVRMSKLQAGSPLLKLFTG